MRSDPLSSPKRVDFDVVVKDAAGTGQQATVKFRIPDLISSPGGTPPAELHNETLATGANGRGTRHFYIGAGITTKVWRIEILDSKDNVIGEFFIDVK